MGKTIMEVPCKGCKFREVACHGKCESYLDYRKRLDKQKKIENEWSKHISTQDIVYNVGNAFTQTKPIR